MKYFRFLPFILFLIIVLFFFKPVVFENKLPIPADTIVGLYHPFRDLYAKDYPRGIPFKNFLITDPVRQQYPWRELAVYLENKLELPLWNPYSFSGTPLLANMQSAVFYPFNILFFLLPFGIVWSILIVIQPLLAGVFLYLYLNNLKINKWASSVGAITFALSGFSVAWMEWGTILHVGLWLPLILLSIDKIFSYFKENSKFNPSALFRARIQNEKSVLKFFEGFSFAKENPWKNWSFVFILSLTFSFFAGHLQIFFYVFLFSLAYSLVRWIQFGRNKKVLILFIILNSLFIILTSVQWVPTLQFINHSARDIDQLNRQTQGWFIPWQHLIQFIAPDFFGNPTTLNYWGSWNYAEFVGYVGILPLIMAIFALFFRRDKKTFFYGVVFFTSLIFAFPTIFAKLPYILNIPFLSTAQPTRLLFIADFSLAVLVAFGVDYFIRFKSKKILYPLGFIAFMFLILWVFVFFGNELVRVVSEENILVAKRNLIFPTGLLMASSILIAFSIFLNKYNQNTLIQYCIKVAIIIIIGFDLLRFGWKFTPFTNQEYLFPQTRTIEFLQKNIGNARIMTTDSRILPPNFSIIYRLQSVDGYDPLYLRRYGEFIAASERGKPDITPPFGFNRIITPHNYESKIIDLLGVKYVLSLSDLKSEKLKKVFQEGETRVYENKNVLPRAFFVEDIKAVRDKEEAIKTMFSNDFNFRKIAVVEKSAGVATNPPQGCTGCSARIVSYEENRVVIETENPEEGFLVLTDSFYPTWHAKIDGLETEIYRTDYNFRGIFVSEGRHIVEFYVRLF